MAQSCIGRKRCVYEILRSLHCRIEVRERARITQAAMAKRLGISPRTYLEYLRGTNAPIGMMVILDLLGMLTNEEILKVIGEWKAVQLPLNKSKKGTQADDR